MRGTLGIRARIAYFEDLLAQMRVAARPELFPSMASGYRAEIEKMQRGGRNGDNVNCFCRNVGRRRRDFSPNPHRVTRSGFSLADASNSCPMFVVVFFVFSSFVLS